MFTWICPQCGKEVPPHETECPYCAEREKAASKPAEAPPAVAPVATAAPPPASTAAAPPAQASRPVYYAPARQHGTPGWLVALLVAVGLCAIGGGAYWYTHRPKAAAQAPTTFEKVPTAAGAATGASKVSKFIEVTGFRVTEDQKSRLQVQFLVVNHSGADVGDLAGTVHLRTTQSEPGSKPLASFDFKTTKLGPYESVEFKVITSTGLRAYELPDWQFLTSDVEITSPKD